MLVTVAAQFIIKTANLSKAIYFLSLLSYSINKPKLQMLLTNKNLYSPILRTKNNFAQKNGGAGGGGD